MATVKRFEDLEIWQIARDICKDIHLLTNKTEFSRDFGLRRQIRSSSGSAMDNIAEGFERDGKKEFIQFLSIAKGSSGETRSQIYRALDQEYISKEEFEQEYSKMILLSVKINNTIAYLKKSEFKGNKYREQ